MVYSLQDASFYYAGDWKRQGLCMKRSHLVGIRDFSQCEWELIFRNCERTAVSLFPKYSRLHCWHLPNHSWAYELRLLLLRWHDKLPSERTTLCVVNKLFTLCVFYLAHLANLPEGLFIFLCLECLIARYLHHVRHFCFELGREGIVTGIRFQTGWGMGIIFKINGNWNYLYNSSSHLF